MRGLMVAAPASGQGKTVVTLGLLRALRDAGVAVASGKSGPDYLDPGFHAAATGRPCATLDPWAASRDQLRGRAWEAAGGVGRMVPGFNQMGRHAWEAVPVDGADQGPAGAELLLVEGAMGLYDGAATGEALGAGSSADLAAALGLPVVLVLDIARMGQTAAALVAGLAAARADVAVAGVILNRAGSARHGALVARAVETVRPVLGVIGRDAALAWPARHLGLVQAGEHGDLGARIAAAARVVAAACDLPALLALARPLAPGGAVRRLPPLGQRIAVAEDAAFGFAYGHMLGDWRAQGAEVVPFSPLADQPPCPGADAVLLPGGYPELWAGALAAAAGFRAGMAAAARRGALIYGECGGYMALGTGLTDAQGTRHAMLGLLELETTLAPPRRHLGYRALAPLAGPWPGPLRGHEFHYASTLRAHGQPLFAARDAAGGDLGPMGLVAGRVSGSFAHVVEAA